MAMPHPLRRTSMSFHGQPLAPSTFHHPPPLTPTTPPSAHRSTATPQKGGLAQSAPPSPPPPFNLLATPSSTVTAASPKIPIAYPSPSYHLHPPHPHLAATSNPQTNLLPSLQPSLQPNLQHPQPELPPSVQPLLKRRRTALYTPPKHPLPSPLTHPPQSHTYIQPQHQPSTPPPNPRGKKNRLSNAQKNAQNGLKNFTTTVAAKLRHYGKSSYTAVADELVNDAINRLRSDGTTFNPAEVDKNIRRRVYDALNVFSSMGFVQRNGKQVVWVGTSGFLKLVGVQSECECVKVADQVPHTCSNGKALSLKSASERLKTRIQEKRARLEELRWQEECVQRVVRRNASKDASRLTTSELRVGDDLEFKRPDRNRVDLPFVMVSAAPSTSVSVQMEDCRERIVLGFDGAFRLWDGYSIVGRLVKRDRGASELGILYDGAATREEDEGDVGSASQSDGAGASL